MNQNNCNDLRLYILMRTDLDSLTPGRAAAQASHATNIFMLRHGGKPLVKKWQRQTNQGFGTCIVLGASKEVIRTIIGIKDKFCKGWVIDPEYGIVVNKEVADLLHGGAYNSLTNPTSSYNIRYDLSSENGAVVFRKESTCAYIFGSKRELEHILGELPLY